MTVLLFCKQTEIIFTLAPDGLGTMLILQSTDQPKADLLQAPRDLGVSAEGSPALEADRT